MKEKKPIWYSAQVIKAFGSLLKGQHVRFHLAEFEGEPVVRLFQYKYFTSTKTIDEVKELLKAVRDKRGKLIPVKDQEKTWRDYHYSFSY